MSTEAGCTTTAWFWDARGSITPLAIIYAVVALLAAMVVAAAGSLYLERKQLLALADATALAAVEAYDLEEVQPVAGGVLVHLDERAVREAAIEYVVRHGDATTTVTQVTVAANTVRVTLRGTWRAPVVNEIVPVVIEISATASAHSEFN